jgi:hypothetical protein
MRCAPRRSRSAYCGNSLGQDPISYQAASFPRITRRATVLVENPRGEEFTDGRRYLTFYVPLPLLRKDQAG